MPIAPGNPTVTVTRTDSDDAGRTVRTIQNYQPVAGLSAAPLSPLALYSGSNSTLGSPLLYSGEGLGVRANLESSVGWGPSSWSAAPSTTGPDVNITTLNTYTPDDNIADFIAVNPATGNQRTRYLYGTTLPTSSIARNDLLVAVLYPDAADSADSVQFLYNLQSEVDVMQDQNGTVHNYLRDLFGRQISDQVITLGTGVNDAVLRIDTAYEIRGMVNQVTSYADLAA